MCNNLDLGPQKGPSSLSRILAQQKFLAKELPMLNFVIFSKDRACQLDLLLRSIRQNCETIPQLYNVNVLYNFSSTHEESYQELINEYTKVNWIKEFDFERQTKELFNNNKVCLLTDDTVFFKNFRYIQTEPDETFSFRLGYNTLVQDFHNNTIQPMLKPLEYNGFNIIKWNPNDYPPYCNYGYPFSFDGHVYSGGSLFKILKDSSFKNTNEIVGILHSKRSFITKIVANTHSSCVNVPANNLSGLTEAGKYHAYSTNELRDLYLSGKRIRLDSFHKPILGCHQEFVFSFYTKDNNGL